MATSGKKLYGKPEVETERVFETLGAAGDLWSGQTCTFASADENPGCDPQWGGVTLVDI